jgi:low affinity Fe/Cu permease
MRTSALVERFTYKTIKWCGTTSAFLLSIGLVIAWLITGPIFKWSDTWQLVANTFTTLVEFVMVFVVQRTINKESAVIHMKLDNLLAANAHADPRLIKFEDLPEAEVQAMEAYYRALGEYTRSGHNEVPT